eukprot:TRINITY_DN22225_c0_g1_i1.p1 TRINITY_DN22225_c0_g1~~TRINITY_DN22225_c0_g1_i1.p1  ORF type:complete len:930 (-),score=77.59 TRINITY_DN22225_c0_g1_i1:42-2831(-)
MKTDPEFTLLPNSPPLESTSSSKSTLNAGTGSPFFLLVFDSEKLVFSRNTFDDMRLDRLEDDFSKICRVPSPKQLWCLTWTACHGTLRTPALMPLVLCCRWVSVVCVVFQNEGRPYAREVIRRYAQEVVVASLPETILTPPALAGPPLALSQTNLTPPALPGPPHELSQTILTPPPAQSQTNLTPPALPEPPHVSSAFDDMSTDGSLREPSFRSDLSGDLEDGALSEDNSDVMVDGLWKSNRCRMSETLNIDSDGAPSLRGRRNEKMMRKEKQRPDERDAKRKQKQKQDIDEMFADLETAVKYLGKLLYNSTLPPRSLLMILPCCLSALLSTLMVLGISIIVVLPTFFSVLVIRMLKVEVTKDKFVHRAVVIAAETSAKHTLRLCRLLLRAFPMITAIILYPFILLHVLLPLLGHGSRHTVAHVGVALFVSFIILLQLQGTVRATLTFHASQVARDLTRHNAARVIERWWRWLRGSSHHAAAFGVGAKAIGAEMSDVPTFQVSELHSLEVGVGIPPVRMPFRVPKNPDFVLPSFNYDIEAHQFGLSFVFPELPSACFSLSHLEISLPQVKFKQAFVKLPPTPTLPVISVLRDAISVLALLIEALQLATLPLRALPKISWLDLHVFPIVFIRITTPAMVLFWLALGAVGGAILLVSGRLMYEIRRYEELQHTSGRREADAFFFHSFVGSLLYGHGQPERLPGALCGGISLICDLLFFALVDNVCSVMVCFRSSEVYITGTSVECWSASHRRMCTIAMVAFGYFVPLSILVAPVLAEANKNSKRVTFVKPYLMCINLSKVAAVILMVLFSSRELPCVIVSFCLCLFIASLTLVWALHASLRQPAMVPVVNVTRFLGGFGALLCSLLAVSITLVPALNVPGKDVLIVVVLLCCNMVLPGLCLFYGVPTFLNREGVSDGTSGACGKGATLDKE